MKREQGTNPESEKPVRTSLEIAELEQIEELEKIVAPAISMNSNETLVADLEDQELEIEKLDLSSLLR